MLKFIQCPQASREREKNLCFSMNWYNLSSPQRIWGASQWGDLTQQVEQDTHPQGCGGFTCRASKSRDASHCSRQDLPGLWRAPGLCQLHRHCGASTSQKPGRELKGGAAERRGDATHRDTWQCQRQGHGCVGPGRNQLPHLPQSCWEGTDVPQPPIPTAGICWGALGESFGAFVTFVNPFLSF